MRLCGGKMELYFLISHAVLFSVLWSFAYFSPVLFFPPPSHSFLLKTILSLILSVAHCRIHETRESAEKAFADDFDTPRAMEAVVGLMKYINQLMRHKTEVGGWLEVATKNTSLSSCDWTVWIVGFGKSSSSAHLDKWSRQHNMSLNSCLTCTPQITWRLFSETAQPCALFMLPRFVIGVWCDFA